MHSLGEFPGVWLLLAFALYGLAGAMAQGYRLFRWGIRPHARHGISLLVLVQNQEQQIEGFVRSLIAHVRGRSTLSVHGELLLVDLASVDETPLILERLVRQDPQLRLVRLPDGAPPPVLESALFLCSGRVALMIDLRGKVDAAQVLHIFSTIW
jgi:hypothetical protein